MKPTHKLFAAGAAVFIAAASQLILTSNKTANAQANQTPPKQAIIVLRHAEDPGADQDGTSSIPYVQKDGVGLSKDWHRICPNWPKTENMASTQTVYSNGNYQTVTHGSVTTFQHGLTPYIGEAQAERLKNELPDILKSQGIAPVKRVVTINPCPESSSPNPFDTVYPFLVGNEDFGKINKEREIKDEKSVPTAAACRSLLLLDNTHDQKTNNVSNDLQALLNRDGLLPTAAEGGGSTILCWEGLALTYLDNAENNILRQLAGNAIYDLIDTDVPCSKGNVLYIFTKRENTGPDTSLPKYDLYIYRAMTLGEPSRNQLGKLTWTRIYEVKEGPKSGEAGTFTRIDSSVPADLTRMNFSL